MKPRRPDGEYLNIQLTDILHAPIPMSIPPISPIPPILAADVDAAAAMPVIAAVLLAISIDIDVAVPMAISVMPVMLALVDISIAIVNESKNLFSPFSSF